MNKITVIAEAALLFLIVGCGSTPASGSGPATSSPASAPAPSSPPSSQLKLAGTITETANAATIALTDQVGPIQYTPPPAAVLSACNIVDPASISEIASSPGEVRIAYVQGSLVQPIIIQTDGLISGDNWQGVVAFEIAGQWQCQSDNGPITLDAPAHSIGTYPIWIMSQVLSNSQPKVTTAEANAWQFPYLGITMAGALLPNVTTSGPDAASCGGMDVLMVYAHLPFTVTDPESGEQDSCKQV